MASITFWPDNRSVEVEPGGSVLQAAQLAGVLLETPCNGIGVCGKCKVKVETGREHISNLDESLLAPGELDQGYVLGCHALIHGDAVITILNQHQNQTLKILDHGESFAFSLDSHIRKDFIPAEGITRIYAGESFLGVEAGDTSTENFGVVVDIGTTTLVTALVNLISGEEIKFASALNPQALRAQDVLSRIKLASDAPGLNLMHREVMAEIQRLIDDIAELSGINKKYIYEVVFSGNTCMLHLAAGINPESLGKYPYVSQLNGSRYLKARELKLNINQYGLVYLPPIISAYVGADITSGLLASQLHHRPGRTLLIDIGTNGEMVIGQNGRLYATSTAAGPAFEGMNISHGMRAGRGAIEQFAIGEDGQVNLRIIGGGRPRGICGSGLMDVVGELVAHKLIKGNGRFAGADNPELPLSLRERLVTYEGRPAFLVADKVYLTQNDVRQVQLAKGALRSGIEFLLSSKNLQADEIDRVLIAGSFGYHLQEKSLLNIGLLPREFAGKIEFVGNTSKSGGAAFLLNQQFRREMEDLVGQVEVIELANYEGFDRLFVKCLTF